MNPKVLTDASHSEDDLYPLIALATLGEAIERAMLDPTSPFTAMLDRARDDFLSSVSALIEADLTTGPGIAQAIRLQAQTRRYQDLCRWIKDSKDNAHLAGRAIADTIEDDGVEQLKDQLYGHRSKPAPDA